jgi:cysteinyl-tRNA synthetase
MIYYTEFGLMDVEIQSLVDERTSARQNKQFGVADQIRQTLQDHHITIEDRPNGTTHWYKFRRYYLENAL